MSKDYFRKLIEESRKEERELHWEGTCPDYMPLVKENPNIVQLASGRIYHMIRHKGTLTSSFASKTMAKVSMLRADCSKEKQEW